jgi:hypothetical protein
MPNQNRFRQLHLADMEHGLAQTYAVFDLTPKQISDLTGIRFDTAREGDFDYVLGALLETPGGKQFSLRRYYHSPFQGRTELIGSESSQNRKLDLAEFLEALQIPDHFVLWKIA